MRAAACLLRETARALERGSGRAPVATVMCSVGGKAAEGLGGICAEVRLRRRGGKY